MKFPFLAPLMILALLIPSLRAEDDSPVFIVKNDIISSPAAPGSTAPQLINAPDGAVYLSWLEPAPDRRIAFRFARFDAAAHTWSPARTVSEGLATDVPRDQTLRLAITADGRLAAAWQPAAGIVVVSTSADGGANWSAPLVFNRPGQLAADAALQSLTDGKILAAWLEPAAGKTALVARDLTMPPAAALMIDASASPAGAPSLIGFPDGSALVAYRSLAADGGGDIRAARFHDGGWDAPSVLAAENVKPLAVPHDGPALVARGVHVSAAWFTATDDARVNVSASDNAGAQWLMANRVDDVAPLGRPALVLFDDGSQLVSWVENTATGPVVLLRRISARGNLSVPVRLGPVPADTAPSLARVKDGDATPAQILVATLDPPLSSSAPSSGSSALSSQLSALSFLTTRLITLPSATALAAADPCGCDSRAEDMRGYPIKGRVVSLDAARCTLQLEHGDIIGVMKAGTTTVQAAPEILRALRPGQTILARVERDGPAWSLFAVRILAAPK